MFDIGISPWLIVGLIGLILFRPHDWHELAFHGGKWIRYLRAYIYEWAEYFEFMTPSHAHAPTLSQPSIPQQARKSVTSLNDAYAPFHAHDADRYPSQTANGHQRLISRPPL